MCLHAYARKTWQQDKEEKLVMSTTSPTPHNGGKNQKTHILEDAYN